MDQLSELKERIDRYQVITFDVFDTLLIRAFAKPKDLFKCIESSVKKSGFSEIRVKSEIVARKRSLYEEIRLDEIYDENPSLTPEMKALEVRFEENCVLANQEMKAIYDYCRSCGKRIFIISDMYLPKGVIERILRKNGYEGWDKIYVSETYRKSKSAGSLFHLFLSEQKIRPESVLHIGDNPCSDGKKARELGMSVFLYEKPIDRFLKSKREKLFIKQNDDLTASMVLGLLHAFPQDKEIGYWERFGHHFAGPVLVGYVNWLRKKFELDKIDHVLFVGRDGYILQKLFEKMGGETPSTYLFAPRYLSALCAAKSACNGSLSDFNNTHLSTAVDYFVLKKVLAKDLIVPRTKNERECLDFLMSVVPNLEERLEDELKEYKEYLEFTNIPEKGRLAVVDSCSIHLSSQKLLQSFLPSSTCIGYYWWIQNGFRKEDLEVYETRTFQESHNSKFIDWDLMEFIMTAPYPGVSYIKDCKVIFQSPHSNEVVRNQIFLLMEKGVLQFAEEYIRVFSCAEPDWNAEALSAWINLFCLYPSLEDRDHFSIIKHADDAANLRWSDCIKSWSMKYPADVYVTIFGKKFRLLFVNKVGLRDNCYYLVFRVPLFRIKDRGNLKRWYFAGIPILEREIAFREISFRLFRIVTLLKLRERVR